MDIKDKTIGVTEIICRYCGETKSTDNYHIFESHNMGANKDLHYRRYRATCKNCQYIKNKNYLKKYYIDNKETYQKNGAKWHQANKQTINGKRNNRSKNDKIYNMKEKIRDRILKAIKNQSTSKAEKTNILLGSTGKQAYEYLKKLGYDERIHQIDHMIPINYFDLSIKKHQLVCFNYRNLQPMDKISNIQKSDNLPDGWEEKLKEICQVLGITLSSNQKII